MTDSELIDALLARDNDVTKDFFFVRCRPLLLAIIRLVFNSPVDYDELVSELYAFLMENDGAKLRQFSGKCSFYQWLKVVATRFFIHKRNCIVSTACQPPLSAKEDFIDSSAEVNSRLDLEALLSLIENERYTHVIRHLILADECPENYASEAGITVANLYNIKRRAIAALQRVAFKYYNNENQ